MIDLQQTLYKDRVKSFVEESNMIENVFDRNSFESAFDKTLKLLAQPYVDIADLSLFNNTNGELRDRFGMNVKIGGHNPPAGGIEVLKALNTILRKVNERADPYTVHQEFETLHPYMDGNGRTGRALWLWQMVRQQKYKVELGFLHKYYYQSLDVGRK